MRVATILLLSLFCCSPTYSKPRKTSGPSNLNLDKYVETFQLARQRAIEESIVELARARTQQKNLEIPRLEKALADLENPLLPYYQFSELNLSSANVGDVGRVLNARTDVFSVVDGKNVIIVAKWHQDSSSGSNFTSGVESAQESFNRIQSAAASSPKKDKSDLRIPEKLLWLAGVSTNELENGGTITLNGMYAITGNRTYTTANGSSNTIFLIESVDLNKYADKFTRKNEARTWKFKNGDDTTKAILAHAENDRATLVKLDGKSIDVELSKLSDDDRDYVSKVFVERTRLKTIYELEEKKRQDEVHKKDLNHAKVLAEAEKRYLGQVRHTFTDASGKHHIDAAAVKFDGTTAELIRMNDKHKISIPIEKLSDEDQTWLRNSQSTIASYGQQLERLYASPRSVTSPTSTKSDGESARKK